eukprot:CAMPEP_0113583202 /NCGR_PEP_ID=MMETSP0015_2-20120614/32372_1 /TAXON_ID=2838 /ORGANISM="Odontella" /LENGTH=140 /DNA_ID=CAMNT_0000488025 /DNA_START=871 /DNA_END=1289 /DNA_ORIENTATION=+ /assembly_acc=CAM_ASM_000160
MRALTARARFAAVFEIEIASSGSDSEARFLFGLSSTRPGDEGTTPPVGIAAEGPSTPAKGGPHVSAVQSTPLRVVTEDADAKEGAAPKPTGFQERARSLWPAESARAASDDTVAELVAGVVSSIGRPEAHRLNGMSGPRR